MDFAIKNVERNILRYSDDESEFDLFYDYALNNCVILAREPYSVLKNATDAKVAFALDRAREFLEAKGFSVRFFERPKTEV
jgi:hypothetical protein